MGGPVACRGLAAGCRLFRGDPGNPRERRRPHGRTPEEQLPGEYALRMKRLHKFEAAQTVLQVVYDYTSNGELDRVEKLRLQAARQQAEKLRSFGLDPEGNFEAYREHLRHEGGLDDYEIEKGVLFERMINDAAMGRDQFFTSLEWLAARQLLCDYLPSIREGLQLPRLSVSGEDLVDLGVHVQDWYHGTYYRNHYAHTGEQDEE